MFNGLISGIVLYAGNHLFAVYHLQLFGHVLLIAVHHPLVYCPFRCVRKRRWKRLGDHTVLWADFRNTLALVAVSRFLGGVHEMTIFLYKLLGI